MTFADNSASGGVLGLEAWKPTPRVDSSNALEHYRNHPEDIPQQQKDELSRLSAFEKLAQTTMTPFDDESDGE